MPVSVVVGGQYGSEGKGKVAHFLCKEMRAGVAVRVGGPNSGHTVMAASPERLVLRQLPTGALEPQVKCVVGVGSYVDPDLLLQEVATTRLPSERLLIDAHAVIICDDDRHREQTANLRNRLGSTLTGVGAALQRRIARGEKAIFAKDDPRLHPYVGDSCAFLREQLAHGIRVVIEGTQGFGLSLYHGTYPFVTSRDTTAAGFISEAGISPRDVDDIVLVVRAFPIRVAGNSGPLPSEITWDEVSQESGTPEPLIEYTSVTHKVRRVARFDPVLVRRAIDVNQPTRLVVNHLDYADFEAGRLGYLTSKAALALESIERGVGRTVDFVGLGPDGLLRRKDALLAPLSNQRKAS